MVLVAATVTATFAVVIPTATAADLGVVGSPPGTAQVLPSDLVHAAAVSAARARESSQGRAVEAAIRPTAPDSVSFHADAPSGSVAPLAVITCYAQVDDTHKSGSTGLPNVHGRVVCDHNTSQISVTVEDRP